MIKIAYYPCWGHNLIDDYPKFNKVAYYLDGNLCYYTGIEKIKRTPTINAVESIITGIAIMENRPVTSLRYFDIQCTSGYAKYAPGQYEISEVIFLINPDEKTTYYVTVSGENELTLRLKNNGDEIYVIEWVQRPPRDKILIKFREYIGIADKKK